MVGRTSAVPIPCYEKDVENWVNLNHKKGTEELHYVIKINDNIVGACVLKKIGRYEKNRCELAYWIGKEYWGNGYAKKAAMKLRDYAFDKLGVKRLDAHTLEINNPASRRILTSIGFTIDEETQPMKVKHEKFISYYEGDKWIFYKLLKDKWLKIINN